MASEKVLTAIERARMVAAKLTQNAPVSNKRPADESNDDGPNKKYTNISDVIGKGGEQMVRIQNDTGCKLQIAAESRGAQERIVTLMGGKENIDKARRQVEEIVRRGMSNAGDGVEVYEMTIPGSKCGVIIGKGGETIKRLSEQFNVKLVVVQEANTPLNADKPLRITGDRDGVKRAKEAVLELLAPPQDHRPPSKYSTNEYGSRYNGDRGGDRGGDRHGDRGGDRGGDRYGGDRGGDRANNNDSYIRVPADRAGVVIGKGGETIKDINRRSGAHVEIDRRNPNVDPDVEKMFIIRGSHDQIVFAQQLIYEKLTGVIGASVPQGYFGPQAIYTPATNPPAAWGANGSAWQQPQWPDHHQAHQHGAHATSGGAEDPNGGYDAAWAAYYASYYAAAASQQQAAQQPQPPSASSNPTSTDTNGDTSATTQASINPQTGQPDYSQAWIDYYRSLGMHAEAEAIAKQASTTAAAVAAAAATTAANAKQSTTMDNNSNQQPQASTNWQQYAAAYASYHGYQPQSQAQ